MTLATIEGAPLIELRGVGKIYGAGESEVRVMGGADLRDGSVARDGRRGAPS